MHLSFLALIMLAVLGLFVIGGIAALGHNRTRPLGYALLLVPVALIALAAFRMFGLAALGGATRVSWAVLRMPLAAVVVVVSISAFVALLANRRTRPVGYALLAVPVVLAGLIVFFALFFYPVARHSRNVAHSNINTYQASRIELSSLDWGAAVESPTMRQYGKPKSAQATIKPQKPKNPAKPKAEAAEAAEANPSHDGETTKSIVRALSTAFAQTLAELKRIPAQKAEGEKASNKSADIKPADKSASDESPEAKSLETEIGITEIVDAERINQMVEVLSGAVRQELPDNVEVDQFTALRALGKLLGRVIVSEQQEEQAASEALDTNKTSAVNIPKDVLVIKKTSAVAKSAAVADSGNGKRPAKVEPADKTSASHRPDWVDAQPRRIGDAYQVVIVAGPFTTRLECDQDMPEQLNRAVAEYAELYLGNEKARRVRLSPDFLRRHMIKDQWEETFQSTVGPMVRVHARVLFDGRTNSELKDCLRRVIVEARLFLAGCGLAATLIVLAGCFGVLKIDNTTGGRYRGWMFFVFVIVTMLTTAVVGTWLLKSTRPAAAPDRPIAMQSTNAPIFHIQEKAPDNREMQELVRPQPAVAGVATSQSRGGLSIVIFGPVFFLLLCLTIGLIAFKKTRVAGLILLSAEVVVALGTLVLVHRSVMTTEKPLDIKRELKHHQVKRYPPDQMTSEQVYLQALRLGMNIPEDLSIVTFGAKLPSASS